jgi:release factor glutamine methyltransferase
LATTIKSALQTARELLAGHGVETPSLDTEVLLAHVTGLDRAGLYRRWESLLAEEEEDRFFALTGRRLSGEPVAYLTGSKEFMGLEFEVDHRVLIPRPETELLVETALKILPPAPVIIDVGTGSGAIAISLAFYRPQAVVYACDLAPEALAVARSNAVRHGVASRVFFFRGDLLKPLAGRLPAGGADLVAANLPYITSQDLPGLPREVRLFEPLPALDGGADGLELYRRLVRAAPDFLQRGGWLLMESGDGLAYKMAGLLVRLQWETVVLKDLAGHDRLVAAVRRAGR